jgi:hypothetical protein
MKKIFILVICLTVLCVTNIFADALSDYLGEPDDVQHYKTEEYTDTMFIWNSNSKKNNYVQYLLTQSEDWIDCGEPSNIDENRYLISYSHYTYNIDSFPYEIYMYHIVQNKKDKIYLYTKSNGYSVLQLLKLFDTIKSITGQQNTQEN